MLVEVSSASDPRLAPYLAIRERDLVGREGSFIAEGEVVVRVLATRGSFAIRSLLLERRRVDALGDVIEKLDCPIYVAPQEVMDQVVGFAIHRGVLALGARGTPRSPEEVIAAGKIVVAMIGISNHDNVGSIFRNAAAFGATVLFDEETCDPLYRKSIRVSAGTALVVPFAKCNVLEAIEASDLEAIALSPKGEESLASLPPGRKRALLLGAEGPGLPPEVMARARCVRIDMEPGLDSLNVAVTSGIALYEAARSLVSATVKG